MSVSSAHLLLGKLEFGGREHRSIFKEPRATFLPLLLDLKSTSSLESFVLSPMGHSVPRAC